MKKSPMPQRTKQMPRNVGLQPGRPPRRKAKASKADAARKAWGEQFTFCWLCLRTAAEIELHTHEINSRAQSSQWRDPRGLFRACRDCNCGDLEWLPEAFQLALKKLYDPESYDRVFVNTARGRAPNAITENEVNTWHRFIQGMRERA